MAKTGDIEHVTAVEITSEWVASRQALSDAENDQLDKAIDILKKLQNLYNDPNSDHSLIRQFELWGGSETGRKFSIPKANNAYNIVQTARESFLGLDNTMSKGMAHLTLETRSFHADTPRWMYALFPRISRPYLEPWIKSVTRSFITVVDSIPLLKPFTRLRQLRSFFSPVDAKYDMMARASAHCSDMFYRDESVLIADLQEILLTSSKNFKKALVFEMYASDLHIVNQIKELSPENQLRYNNNIARSVQNPSKNQIIQGQILEALNGCVDTLINGPLKQGSTSRAGFLSETLACYLDVPNLLAAYKHGLKNILGQEDAYEAALKDDLSKRNTLITGVPLNVGGIPTLVAMEKRMTHTMAAAIEKAQELRNATNPFEHLSKSAARKAVRMRSDKHFMKWQTIKTYREAMESREKGYDPNSIKEMGALKLLEVLKGENYHFVEAKPFDDRLYLQKEAANYFLNVLAPIVRHIDILYDAWVASKNDSAKEIRALQYYYTELSKHTAAIVAHSEAFNSTGDGALPDDVCRAFDLKPNSTCVDMMKKIRIKNMGLPNEQTQSRYWHFRVETAEAQNMNQLEPTMVDYRDGKKYSDGLMLDPLTKSLVPYFDLKTDKKQRFEEDAKIHAEGIGEQMTAVANACKYNAGVCNSLFNDEWPPYISAMEEVIKASKGNKTKNWNGTTVIDTPIVYVPEEQIEGDNFNLRGIRTVHRRDPEHVTKSAINNVVEFHRIAAYAGTGRSL